MKARNKKTGALIVGALVDLVGRAGATDFARGTHGRLTWADDGNGTTVDWDSAITATDEHGALFLDANGEQVSEPDIELFEEGA